MHSVVESMLVKYECQSVDDHKNALKEIIQEIALLGLFRSGFFEVAAFYGGTSLRIFYGLDRFSEDLDFSLLKKNNRFDITDYCKAIQNEMMAYGFDVEVVKKKKSADSAIESAFIKCGTLTHFLKIGSIRPPVSGLHKNELLKIRLEVDTHPPTGAKHEIKYLLTPIPFSVRVYVPSSLFAGKLHAILCRTWNSGRVKGRDLYDYVWYLSKGIRLNMKHLGERMKQTGHLEPKAMLTREMLFSLLEKKFWDINYEQAKRDILPFIKEPASLHLWSKDFFQSITRDKLSLENDR